MIAAMRIAVPVAESQFRMKTAGSAVAWVTTGGTRCTILSRPGMANRGAEMWSSSAFTAGRPHRKTTIVRMTHGSHGETPFAVAGGAFDATVLAASPGNASRPPRQTRRNAVRQTIDVTDATISTSQGP